MSVTRASLLGDTFGSSASGTIPVGGIIMWSGSTGSIPTGWALCNGSSGTPDLRSRFIVGATSDASTGVTFNANTGAVSGAYAPGNTGGETAHQLTTAEMPSHNHSASVDRDYTYSPRSAGTQSGGSNKVEGLNNQTPTVTIGSTGGDDYHENRPPYYALAFIMRVS